MLRGLFAEQLHALSLSQSSAPPAVSTLETGFCLHLETGICLHFETGNVRFCDRFSLRHFGRLGSDDVCCLPCLLAAFCILRHAVDDLQCLACCSMLLCKNMFTAALCHYSYTYGDLLFIQVCSDATPMHCSTGHGRTAGLLFSAALQNRLTARLCHCSYTYGDLLFIQVCSDATPMHCSTGQGRTAFSLFCAALQTGSQHDCSTAVTPMEICS